MKENLKEEPIEQTEETEPTTENEVGARKDEQGLELSTPLRHAQDVIGQNDNTDDETKQEEWFTKDALEFQKAFPDINTDELFQDKAFLRFSEGKVGKVGLADIYRDYTEIVESIRKDTIQKAEEEFAKRRAKAKATPGSLTEVSGETDSLYSLEDMKNMSQKAIIANWDKVQKSLKNLKK